MSQSITQVDYEALQRIAKNLRQESENIDQLHGATRQKMDSLQKDWIGSAADSFFVEMEEVLLPGVDRLSQALLISEDVLKQIIKTFSEADLETVGYYKNLDGADGETPTNRVKTRIYLINGINYDGSDESFNNLKGLLEQKYGKDVEVVVVGAHPYNTDLQQYAPAISTAISYGKWVFPSLSILDNRVVRDFTGSVLGLANTAVGAGQVLDEYVTGGATQSNKVYEWIRNDMQRNGLIGAESLNVMLLAHSGGGAIAANIVDNIENELNVNVSSIVTMGSPLSNFDYASQYAEKIVDIAHPNDLVRSLGGLGAVRSDELRNHPVWLVPVPQPFSPITSTGIHFSLHSTDPLFRNSGIDVNNVVTHDNASSILDAHGSYWNSPEVVEAIGKAL